MLDDWIVTCGSVRYLNLISKNPKALDTALRVLDNGRSLLDTALRVLDHWVVSHGKLSFEGKKKKGEI